MGQPEERERRAKERKRNLEAKQHQRESGAFKLKVIPTKQDKPKRLRVNDVLAHLDEEDYDYND